MFLECPSGHYEVAWLLAVESEIHSSDQLLAVESRTE